MSRVLESRVREVGRITPLDGLPWEESLATARGRADAFCQFLPIAARVLGLALSEVWLSKTYTPPSPTPREAGSWHFDAAKKRGHVLCVAGESPTEFLVGEFDRSYCSEAFRLAELEQTLRVHRCEPGAVIHIDHHVIHRRPVSGSGHRLFLLGAVRD